MIRSLIWCCCYSVIIATHFGTVNVSYRWRHTATTPGTGLLLATSQLPSPDTADTKRPTIRHSAEYSSTLLNIRYHVDITRTTSRAGMAKVNNYIYRLGEHRVCVYGNITTKRRQRWNETASSIDCTQSSRKAWQRLNRLTEEMHQY